MPHNPMQAMRNQNREGGAESGEDDLLIHGLVDLVPLCFDVCHWNPRAARRTSSRTVLT